MGSVAISGQSIRVVSFRTHVAAFASPAFFCLLTAILANILSTSASAGVYLFRDREGRMVLSDAPSSPKADRVIGDPKEDANIQQFVGDRERVSLYSGLIRKYSRQYNLPEALVNGVVQVESAFNPNAVSSKGATGLMQVMPSTARDMGIIGNLKDPEINIDAGCRYLAMMLSRFKGQLPLALAGYNAGPEAVVRSGGIVPEITETKNYVTNVMEAMKRFGSPGSVYVIEVTTGRFLLTNY